MQLYDTIQRKGSVEIRTSEEFDKPKLCMASEMEEFAGIPYLKTLEKAIGRSVAGNSANTGLWYANLYHEKNCTTLNEFRSTIDRLNTRMEDGRKVMDVYAEMEEQMFNSAFDVASGILRLATNGQDEFPPMLREIDSSLREWALEAADYKLIRTAYWGALVEEKVADAIEDEFDVTVLRANSEITAETGIEKPEPTGIDLWVKEEEIGIQVKEGTGGDVDDDSDLTARYIWEDVEFPVVNIFEE